jgi:hypothetical protein
MKYYELLVKKQLKNQKKKQQAQQKQKKAGKEKENHIKNTQEKINIKNHKNIKNN